MRNTVTILLALLLIPSVYVQAQDTVVGITGSHVPYSYGGRHESYADVNGDGRDDKVWIPVGSQDIKVAFSNGNGFDAPKTALSRLNAGNLPLYSGNGWHESYQDINNDGLADRLWIPAGYQELKVAFSYGNGFRAPVDALTRSGAFYFPLYSTSGQHESYQDVNGDGFVDRVWLPAGYHDLMVAYGNGNRFNVTKYAQYKIWNYININLYSTSGWHESYLDVNGDGLADRAWISAGHQDLRVAISSGNYFDYWGIYGNVKNALSRQNAGNIPLYSSSGQHESYQDINGDGLADRVWIPAGHQDIKVAFSNGNGYFSPPVNALTRSQAGNIALYSYGGRHESYQDVNGDGLADRVWIPDGQSVLYYALSTGSGFSKPKTWSTGSHVPYSSSGQHESFVDIDGDGRMDRVWVPYGKNTLYISFFR